MVCIEVQAVLSLTVFLLAGGHRWGNLLALPDTMFHRQHNERGKGPPVLLVAHSPTLLGPDGPTSWHRPYCPAFG